MTTEKQTKPAKENKEAGVLIKELEECEKLKNEYLAGWQRARADFINFRKEETERFVQVIAYANEAYILQTLYILDGFLLAEKTLPEKFKDDEYVKGLLLIKAQLSDFLKSQGVEPIEAVGKKFDPNFHEVVEEISKPDAEPGTIIEETQKGYLLDKKVLRAAKVKISK